MGITCRYHKVEISHKSTRRNEELGEWTLRHVSVDTQEWIMEDDVCEFKWYCVLRTLNGN